MKTYQCCLTRRPCYAMMVALAYIMSVVAGVIGKLGVELRRRFQNYQPLAIYLSW